MRRYLSADGDVTIDDDDVAVNDDDVTVDDGDVTVDDDDVTVSEDQLSPRTRCPPGHVVLGPAVPPDI